MEFQPKVPSKLDEVVAGIRAFMTKVAIAGSGSDAELLEKYGSAQCRAKQRAVGYVNFAASSLGALGASAKAFTLLSGPLALPIAMGVGALYFGVVFNLERMLAAGISAFWTPATKAKAFLGRLACSLIVASFQAVPVVMLAMGTQLDARLARFELEAREEAKAALEKLHGVKTVDQKTVDFSKAAQDAAQQVWVLPEAVIDAQQLAARCDKDTDALIITNRRKAAALQAKLPALSNIELSTTATAAQKAAAKKERGYIAGRVNRLADEVVAKKGECKTAHAQATDARNRYVNDANTKRAKAETDLDKHKLAAAEVAKALKADTERANEVAKKGNAANSAAEVKAAVALIIEEPYARLKAAWIYLGFILIDVAGVGLKLLAKPGPYDNALRKRDELARIGAEQAIRDAEHEDAAKEMESAAKLKGIAQFHQQDAGAVFASLERLAQDFKVRLAEETHDIKLAAAQVAEIEPLVMQVEGVIARVRNHPALVKRLQEVLAILRAPVAPNAA